jgi:GDPmannose 4,6-dehydratase
MAFKCVNLDLADYLIINQSLFRPTDLQRVVGNPEKARKILGWSSNHDLEWIVSEMFANKINL